MVRWLEAEPTKFFLALSLLGNTIGITITYLAGMHILKGYNEANLIASNPRFFLFELPSLWYGLPLIIYLLLLMLKRPPSTYLLLFSISNTALSIPMLLLFVGTFGIGGALLIALAFVPSLTVTAATVAWFITPDF